MCRHVILHVFSASRKKIKLQAIIYYSRTPFKWPVIKVLNLLSICNTLNKIPIKQPPLVSDCGNLLAV